MANSVLGIFIDDNVIKYAKVQKEKDELKVEAFNIVFYENLEKELNRIITETGSSKIPICFNVSHESYNYFDVIAFMKKKDRENSIKMDFSTLCVEKGLDEKDFDTKFLLRTADNNADKITALHIAVNKEELEQTTKLFVGKKIDSVEPITTSILNIVDFSEDEKENVIIVNLEGQTKITTIIDGSINRIDTLNIGMNDILGKINETENSMRKSYDIFKNTTIYTQDPNDMNMDDNEHLEEIIPTLYEIVNQTKNIMEESSATIHKVYITGLGSAVNNIDLYFQEYMISSKCEILSPFFLETAALNTSFKDYVEVNSAIALALDGLGYSSFKNDLNFKTSSGGSLDIDFSNLFGGAGGKELDMNMKGPLDSAEKLMIRISVICLIAIVVYLFFSNTLMTKLQDMTDEANRSSQQVAQEITKVENDIKKIETQTAAYKQSSELIENVLNGNAEAMESVPIIPKGSIKNLLKSLSRVIPKDVTIASIKNTEDLHVVIEAYAPTYEQVGYFKALISTNGLLKNVKSSSGQKIRIKRMNVSDYESAIDDEIDVVYITIEGDF